jgi:hypothetical protein
LGEKFSSLKKPFLSVAEPKLLPSIKTVAPGIGSPSSLVTLPVAKPRVPWLRKETVGS